GVLDLEDVQLDLLAGELLELAADAVGLGAAAAADDAGAGGVDVHAHAVPGPLDRDLGYAGPLHARGHERADLDVLTDVVLVALALLGGVRVPVRHVVGGDAQPEPVRVDLLSHLADLLAVRARHDHGDVARALVDAVGAALGARLEPLHGRTLV